MTRRLLLLLCLAAASPALADGTYVALKDSLPHMTVTGDAKVDVVPDQADVDFAVIVAGTISSHADKNAETRPWQDEPRFAAPYKSAIRRHPALVAPGA